jgi:hypothetical protein
VRPEDAFGRARARARDWLDATTRRGAFVLIGYTVLVLVACYCARAAGGAAPYVIAIDALVVVPIFFTGTSRQMPPDAAREAVALAPVARTLERTTSSVADEPLKVAPMVRVTSDGREDETRILISPRLAMGGLAGIEVGVAWERAGGATLAAFDVLVRVHDGTFASAKMTAAFPSKRVLPGRKPEERVLRFEPEGPGASQAAALVANLAEILRDRRVIMAAAAREVERRLPPNSKAARSLA